MLAKLHTFSLLGIEAVPAKGALSMAITAARQEHLRGLAVPDSKATHARGSPCRRQLGRDAGDFYRETIMCAEPIAHYRLDEDNGLTAFDESRNKIDGRIIDSVRLAVPGALKRRESLSYEFHPGAGQVQLNNLPVVTAVDGKNSDD